MCRRDISGGRESTGRALRLQIYRWPAVANTLLALVHYTFDGANAAMGCRSISRLLRLTEVRGSWLVQDRYTFETSHHTGLQKVQLVDLSGDGIEELVVESDFGGSGVHVSELTVFDLSGGRIRPLMRTPVREIDGARGDEFTQELDVARTRSAGGGKLCTVKTVYREAQQRISPPLVTRACADAGLDR